MFTKYRKAILLEDDICKNEHEILRNAIIDEDICLVRYLLLCEEYKNYDDVKECELLMLMKHISKDIDLCLPSIQ